MRLIDYYCEHCGQQLMAEWDHRRDGRSSFVIAGAYPVRLTHKNGRDECVLPPKKASAYSIWDVNKLLEATEAGEQ